MHDKTTDSAFLGGNEIGFNKIEKYCAQFTEYVIRDLLSV